jgi:hypothetical protein
VRQKEISTFPPSASIRVYLRFKSAIALTSKRDLALSPIRVHQRASAVQKSDRPYVKKSDRQFSITNQKSPDSANEPENLQDEGHESVPP